MREQTEDDAFVDLDPLVRSIFRVMNGHDIVDEGADDWECECGWNIDRPDGTWDPFYQHLSREVAVMLRQVRLLRG